MILSLFRVSETQFLENEKIDNSSLRQIANFFVKHAY